MAKPLQASTLKAGISPLSYYQNELGQSLNLAGISPWKCGGLCPFHDDRRRGSFRVNIETGAFKCFSCGASGGDIIAFHLMRHGLPFRAAIRDLAGKYLVGGALL